MATGDAQTPPAPLCPMLLPSERFPAVEALMCDSLDDLVSRGGRTSSQSSKGCCALEKACLGITNQQKVVVWWGFLSPGWIFYPKPERKPHHRITSLTGMASLGGSRLKLCFWLGSSSGLLLPPLQGHKGHRGSARIPG